MTKEQTLLSYQDKNNRLQLLKITLKNKDELITDLMYQIRLNRKIIDTSRSEFHMRKLFANYCINLVLQLKIY